ncbi:hypothetical protein BSCG_05137 [Bacteroides sp. 2_2_4]|nr:hypothetical protein BSCG_05137 [Bacteroides sp. 2_2_4]
MINTSFCIIRCNYTISLIQKKHITIQYKYSSIIFSAILEDI